jgi:acyl carrier protein
MDEAMSAPPADVERTIQSFLAQADKSVETLSPDLNLYADGIGLDSLETAELSAILEDEFGSDPFNSDTMPQTVGDILAFYASTTVEA